MGVWNGFLLGEVRGQVVPCRFCGGTDGMVICFGSVLIHPWLRFVKILSFMISLAVLPALAWYAVFG